MKTPAPLGFLDSDDMPVKIRALVLQAIADAFEGEIAERLRRGERPVARALDDLRAKLTGCGRELS